MTVPLLNANALLRELNSGRTGPCVFLCENEAEGLNSEYVVKLSAGIESGVTGLTAELLASQIATILGIPTPEFAIIDINPLMAEIVTDPVLSRKIQESAGLNFGSKVITGGFSTWPTGKGIPTGLQMLAAEIFAFDALIQNPDRRIQKPNILWRGDELYIIDHELGFSFIYDILPLHDPWTITALNFMRNHLFFEGLKGRPLQLDRFAGALELLTDSRIVKIMENIPQAWHNQNHVEKINTHIHNVVQHVDDFVDEVRRTLQ